MPAPPHLTNLLMTGNDAFRIDTKLDDGIPVSGDVLATIGDTVGCVDIVGPNAQYLQASSVSTCSLYVYTKL